LFADAGTQMQPELGGQECLDSDGDDDGDGRQAGQTEAEADGEFVEADADAEPYDGQPADARQPTGLDLLSVTVT
jgi:hypothetical protein